MFHSIVQVRGGLEQDPQVFEGLHTLNNITFKHKPLAWVSRIEHHDFCFFHIHCKSMFTQNYWSVFKCCCNPTSNFDIRARSSAKNNSHKCTFAKVGASHYLPSKRPSRASKYSPNSRGLRGQPCFTPYWHMKLEVTPSLGWLMRIVSLAYIACKHRKKRPSTLRPANTYHNTSHGTISNAFLKLTKQQ
jgi:hypothetical protein